MSSAVEYAFSAYFRIGFFMFICVRCLAKTCFYNGASGTQIFRIRRYSAALALRVPPVIKRLICVYFKNVSCLSVVQFQTAAHGMKFRNLSALTGPGSNWGHVARVCS